MDLDFHGAILKLVGQCLPQEPPQRRSQWRIQGGDMSHTVRERWVKGETRGNGIAGASRNFAVFRLVTQQLKGLQQSIL